MYAIIIKCRWTEHSWIYPKIFDHQPTEKEIASVLSSIEKNNTAEIATLQTPQI